MLSCCSRPRAPPSRDTTTDARCSTTRSPSCWSGSGTSRTAPAWTCGIAAGANPRTIAARTPTCTCWRRSWRSATQPASPSGSRARSRSRRASSTTSHAGTTGASSSTSPPTGDRCPTTTPTSRGTASAPTAPRPATASSGHGSCSSSGPRSPLRPAGSKTRPPPSSCGRSPMGGHRQAASSTPPTSRATRRCPTGCTGSSPKGSERPRR